MYKKINTVYSDIQEGWYYFYTLSLFSSVVKNNILYFLKKLFFLNQNIQNYFFQLLKEENLYI